MKFLPPAKFFKLESYGSGTHLKYNYLFLIIPYIRLFTHHVLSANSSLKSCIKSTRVNFSRNPSESLKIYFICKIVSNLRDRIFHDFDILANIAENGCMRKKPDIRYLTMGVKVLAV